MNLSAKKLPNTAPHILIVGEQGVGKSTLIARLVDELNMPVWGYYTKKESHLADETFGEPVYIYEADKPQTQTDENLVGYCKNRHAVSDIARFDAFAEAHLQIPPTDHLIVLDEIGFMESKAMGFRDAILKLLDGSTHVIAAVKDKDNEFLHEVRKHPNCKCFHITSENRDILYKDVLKYLEIINKP